MTRFECKGEREGFQQLMLMLLLCLRGTPILYYGEELDMEEIILDREQIQDPLGIYFWSELKGRDGCRTPFPWNFDEPNQGFNQGAEPWLSGTSPICLDQAEEMQESTLHLLREMLKIRKSEPALQSGSYRLHLLLEDFSNNLEMTLNSSDVRFLPCSSLLYLNLSNRWRPFASL